MALVLCCVPLPALSASESAESGLASGAGAPAQAAEDSSRPVVAAPVQDPAAVERGSLNDWSPLVVRYLVLSVVCGGAFTLVFVKCWRDASAHAASLAEEAAEAAEQSGDTSENPAAS